MAAKAVPIDGITKLIKDAGLDPRFITHIEVAPPLVHFTYTCQIESEPRPS